MNGFYTKNFALGWEILHLLLPWYIIDGYILIFKFGLYEIGDGDDLRELIFALSHGLLEVAVDLIQ